MPEPKTPSLTAPHADEDAPAQPVAAPPAEGPARTLLVAACVCLVCSLFVSGAEVLLRPYREAHLARERKASLVALVEGIPGVLEDLGGTLDARHLEARVVDLRTGLFVDEADPRSHDPRAAAADPAHSTALPPGRDPAGLGRRENLATVTLLRRDDGRPRLVVLPVRGQGFQSLLAGHVALAGDGNTILGLVISEHGETPGVGSLVTDAAWLARWHGKQVRDATGALRVRVAEGPAVPGSLHEVDGISGATWTCQGVTNLLRFWLGDDGYGPFLQRLAEP